MRAGAQNCTREICLGKIGTGEICTGEIGASKAHLKELCALKICSPEDHTGKISLAEICSTEIRITEVRTIQRRFRDGSAGKQGTHHPCVTEIGTLEGSKAKISTV